uniref:Uncharacterized protein n=1 Tax=Solanum lycopersicum TaxID=4081 RepID=K4BRL3_SOLLC
MALQCNTISEITKNKMKWNLKVGVVHFRTTPNKYKPDIPMVLILQNEKDASLDCEQIIDEDKLIEPTLVDIEEPSIKAVQDKKEQVDLAAEFPKAEHKEEASKPVYIVKEKLMEATENIRPEDIEAVSENDKVN